MNVNTSIAVEQIISILRTFVPKEQHHCLGKDVNILVDIDLDSLQLIEFIEAVENAFSVDLLKDPSEWRVMETPEKLAMLILGTKGEA